MKALRVLEQTFTQQTINTENIQVWQFTTTIMSLISTTRSLKEPKQTVLLDHPCLG